jgi:hypothetical protein
MYLTIPLGAMAPQTIELLKEASARTSRKQSVETMLPLAVASLVLGRVGRIYRVHAQDLQDWWATMRIAPDDPNQENANRSQELK